MKKSVGTAEARYRQMETDRSPFITRAKDCARYTLPMLAPETNNPRRSRFRTPYQGVGARGVNNLASKLLLALFPPNQPFFKLMVDRMVLRQEQQEDLKSRIDSALGKVEQSIMDDVETSGDRNPIFDALKHAVVSGNALLHVAEDGSQVFPLNRYVVQRDPAGNVLEIIVHEQVAPAALEPEFLRVLKAKHDYTERTGREKTVNIFTRIWLKNDGSERYYEVYQECLGETVPGSKGRYPADALPWIPIRFHSVEGEDYGRSHVEEYLGDIKSLEGLTKAIVEGSAAAAKLLILVDPNSVTRAKTIAEAPNGAVRPGRAEDVTVVQMDKFADFRTAEVTVARIEARLEHAFLMNTSIQRQGERVTAEEIRFMAQDLEDALGGVYTALAREIQLPYIRVRMNIMEADGRMPELPDEIVKPTITTGLEALGRGHDRNRLIGFATTVSQVFGPEALPRFLNPEELVTRLATADGIHPDGLVKTQEEVKAEQNGQMVQQVLAGLPPEAQAAVMSALGQAGGGAPGGPGPAPQLPQGAPPPGAAG